jgi:hypothetical protein
MLKGSVILAAAVGTLLLVACKSRTEREPGAVAQAVPAAGDVVVEKGLAIDTPAFAGRVNIPGLSIGGEDMDLDGMKLPPGSSVTGIKVDAPETGKDQVRIAFTSTGAAAAVADHFRAQAKAAGYTLAPGAALDVRGARPDGESFALTVTPAGAGATGALLLLDKD